eukprot:7673297-Alexandrium_andersonii.AAC.1
MLMSRGQMGILHCRPPGYLEVDPTDLPTSPNQTPLHAEVQQCGTGLRTNGVQQRRARSAERCCSNSRASGHPT